MNEPIQFLVDHGYSVLFVWVLAEQTGLPVPSIPFLLAVGALAETGRLNFTVALGVAVLAALLSDSSWYQAGHRYGKKVLHLVCRISLEPDTCVRQTENILLRHGARSLLVAKFLPGLSATAAPLAGMSRMRLSRFLFFDGLGALIWAGSYMGGGYIFSDHLEQAAAYSMQFGSSLIVLLVGALAIYVGRHYIRRQRFIRESVRRHIGSRIQQRNGLGAGRWTKPLVPECKHKPCSPLSSCLDSTR